jgi:uncharacterized membrane protein (UPF0136 family)
MNPVTVLWIYIVLLFLGGLMGFLKAKSKMSLIMAAAFAAILILFNLGIIRIAHGVDIVLIFLLVFFAMRLAKSKKMMPNGVMSILTLVTLVLLHVRF